MDSLFHDLHKNLNLIDEDALLKKEECDKLSLIPKWKFIPMDFKGKNLLKIENENDNNWSSILDLNNIPTSGDRIMKRMHFLLNNIPGIIRHEYQIQFHQEILMALLPTIYKSEWNAYSSIILEKYNIKKYRPERLFVTPRRFGKTMSTVIFACAALYAIPQISIGNFFFP